MKSSKRSELFALLNKLPPWDWNVKPKIRPAVGWEYRSGYSYVCAGNHVFAYGRTIEESYANYVRAGNRERKAV